VARFSVQLSRTHVRVAPDAFGGSSLPIAIAAKELRNQRFHSDAELLAALSAAHTITLCGTISRAR
jgi:hypothetical protein